MTHGYNAPPVSHESTPRPTDGPTFEQRRRVLLGGAVGQFVEFYDFALYGLSALIIATTFFPGQSAATGVVSTFATYGVAFAVRPLGGVVFGILGDRAGRRTVLVSTILLMGVATAIMGSIPSYADIGVLAPVLLLLCRVAQGFSAGGESVGAATFVFEHAPERSRGLWIGICLGVTALPAVVGGGLILALAAVMSEESFSAWGWRIPFWLALPMALLGLWIRLRTEESEEYLRSREQDPETSAAPIREAFRNDKMRMLQVVFVMGLAALNFYLLSGYMVTYVQLAGELSRNAALAVNGAAMLLFAILLPTFGRVSDRYGRRPLLLVGSGLLAVLAVPSFLLVTSGNFALALLGQALYVLVACVFGGGAYVFFLELFRTGNRFTTAAIGYNVGFALFGGTAPLIGAALVESTGMAGAPGWYVALVALLVCVLIVVLRVPETRFGDKAR